MRGPYATLETSLAIGYALLAAVTGISVSYRLSLAIGGEGGFAIVADWGSI